MSSVPAVLYVLAFYHIVISEINPVFPLCSIRGRMHVDVMPQSRKLSSNAIAALAQTASVSVFSCVCAGFIDLMASL